CVTQRRLECFGRSFPFYTMTARLLCPGPSLASYTWGDFPPADLTVGVNRAATFFPCDVWACGDPPLIQQQQEHVIGTPDLLTSVDGHHVCESWNRIFGGELWRGEDLCCTEMM